MPLHRERTYGKNRRTTVKNQYEVALSGNTCMLHLATGAPTASLGKYPYTPAIRGGYSLPATDVGLRIAPFGQVFLPPSFNIIH